MLPHMKRLQSQRPRRTTKNILQAEPPRDGPSKALGLHLKNYPGSEKNANHFCTPEHNYPRNPHPLPEPKKNPTHSDPDAEKRNPKQTPKRKNKTTFSLHHAPH
ncbi:hypothetical protein KC19_VG302800 [Ceratodon purpureus]|uniref:Uncharacterized protein n=1 Tax=Ceratodon purpureus TaxID=3225 RepID=A0A8T0HW27_CERPU|nr:hypothetical protein KC19_VG302800 [Ceratodon purpureus]